MTDIVNPRTDSSISHNYLKGLTDDDHPQYLLTDGSRDATGGITIDGSSDEIQLKVQGHSTQTNYLLTLEQSDGTDVLTVANSGELIIGAGSLGASLSDGVLTLLETTTPTALENYGKIYTKNDNLLYFQDGAGNEHTIAFV